MENHQATIRHGVHGIGFVPVFYLIWPDVVGIENHPNRELQDTNHLAAEAGSKTAARGRELGDDCNLR